MPLEQHVGMWVDLLLLAAATTPSPLPGPTALATDNTTTTATDAESSASSSSATTASVDADADTDVAPRPSRAMADDRGDEPSEVPWIRRWAPTRNEVEVGAYGGAFLLSPDHELYQTQLDPAVDPSSGSPTASGSLGARVGYAPLRFLAVEAEGGAAPSRALPEARATVWHARGSVVGQVGLWSVVPFGLVGAGVLGVASRDAQIGNDVDAAIHFGGGLKVNTSRRVQVRLDLRDTVAARRGAGNGVTHNGEILLGAAVRLGSNPDPAPAPAAPSDRDRDGFADPADACPDRAGPGPYGCPAIDSDADGWLDRDDACPDIAGVEPYGCPVLDRDRDGWSDENDMCPTQPGVEPDGCPLRDTDADGMLDVDDACPEQAEIRNGFEDADGCPDELPKELESFSGVIRGIYFEVDQAVIRSQSRPVLDRAVDVLTRYPSIRVEITGHTDASGSYAHNVELSAARAKSVRAYLVEHGIAGDRVTTRGLGPDEPIADNTSRQGRQDNRRIEFRVIDR